MMRMARPGPGKGWRLTISSGTANGPAYLTHLVFEELAQGLYQLKTAGLWVSHRRCDGF